MRDRDWTALHLAAGAGDRERVDALLREKRLTGRPRDRVRAAFEAVVDRIILIDPRPGDPE